ncbi:MAG: M12 family metallo-peptidase [Saprospiraceae bacterium]
MTYRTKQTIALAFMCCLFSTASLLADSNPWSAVSENLIEKSASERQIIPQKYLTYKLDTEGLQDILAQAPLRFSLAAKGKETVLVFPMPDGTTERFRIYDAPIMHPDLAAKYPLIHSYAGVGLDDPTATVRFDVTQFGCHAMILSGKHSTVLIDPYAAGDVEHYISYYKKDVQKEAHFECGFIGDSEMDHGAIATEKVQGDCMFRTYRLALACTGEYANYHGGNKPDVMAAYNTTMTRVNGVYERDFGVTMVLIPNTDTLIFLDAANDPYTNNNGGTMLGQNQTTCNSLIGSANYDIGHVFSTGGGGIASLNAPCNANNKAQGVTGLTAPVGDIFDIDYVAHEMGHQFGANHTFNNSCGGNISNNTAMEPGSASTIMGYAGICSPNVQNNSDDYFHAISIQEIARNITIGSGSTCPVETDLGNNAPMVDGGNESYILPISTPFRLTALGFDADGDSLTYCWEQMDNESATMPPVSTSTGGPAFRSYDPVNEPFRYFPKLNDIVNDINDLWEELPSVSRDMNFRVTVRDNNMSVGCTDEDDVLLTFTSDAGPFLVQDPNTAVEWYVGDTRTVTWDVAGTDAAPVSCANVDILLSTDGGFTYPITLASNVPNNGAYDITVPIENSTTCRVMVFCSDNVFFDISDENFTITPPPYPIFVGSVAPSSYEVCGSVDSVVYDFTFTSLLGFSDTVTLTAMGAPVDATVTFSQDTFTPSANISLVIGNLSNIASGTYSIQVMGVSDTITTDQTVTLTVTNGVPAISQLSTPADGATDQPLATTLTWEPVSTATEYFIEIATNPVFGASVIESATVATNDFTLTSLSPLTIYYWRVQGRNICGDSGLAAWRSFQTGGIGCRTISSTDTPIAIPNTVATVSSIISISDDLTVTDVNLDMEIPHTWVGHLISTLTSPQGTEVELFNRPGFPGAMNNGCRRNNMLVSFDDDATNDASVLENMCMGFGAPYAIQGDFQPTELLANFNGESTAGDWSLNVSDVVDAEGGSIAYWNLEICYMQTAGEAPDFAKLDLVVPAGGTETITTNNLFAMSASSSAVQISYTLLSLPTNGTLLFNGSNAAVGTVFTQEDILNNLISYTNTDLAATSDLFRFDLSTQDGGWIPNETFNILIGQDTLLTNAVLTNDITCSDLNDANVTVNVSGSNPPFEFSIDGVNYGTDPVFSDLASGDYTFSVRDANGTVIQTNLITVTNPANLIALPITALNTISVITIGGTPPYQYSLNSVDFQVDSTFSNLANDTYAVTVMDANGCVSFGVATINIIVAAEASTTAVSCFGENDGTLSVTLVTGGQAPYTYSLDGVNFQDSNEFTGLSGGNYTVYVMDASGNIFEMSGFSVSSPPALVVTGTVDMNNLTANGSGGTGDLMYSINGTDFQSAPAFTDLPNGTYTITVMDENGCLATSGDVVIDFTNLRELGFDISFDLFPNPTNGQMTLILDQATEQHLSLRIFDVTGRVVQEILLEKTATYLKQSIDVKALPAGSYEVLLTDGAMFGRKRFVKM